MGEEQSGFNQGCMNLKQPGSHVPDRIGGGANWTPRPSAA
jgi:hypothetical protein